MRRGRREWSSCGIACVTRVVILGVFHLRDWTFELVDVTAWGLSATWISPVRFIGYGMR
jgi:hypothetical protein